MPIIYPRAQMYLARILREGTSMNSEQADQNAKKIIEALHRHGLQVGPLAGFGPHDSNAGARDAFDNFDQVLASLESRDPWYELR